ncbi:DUF732 domain-containing protein [Mycolicibacterium phlei]
MTPYLRAGLLASALAGALFGAPVAAASPETEFCASMTGIGFTGDCATISTLAKDVCAEYARGADLDAVLGELDQATKDENLSNFIVAGAKVYFCPEAATT